MRKEVIDEHRSKSEDWMSTEYVESFRLLDFTKWLVYGEITTG